MTLMIDPIWHSWFVLILTALTVYSYVREKISLEATAVFSMMLLILFGQFFPLPNAEGDNLLSAGRLLAGFANPALIAVLALLVMGQGMLQTEALRPVTRLFVTRNKTLGLVALFFLFMFVLIASAFMNNTPLVILAIPLIQILANNLNISESRVMMPLSFMAILGGMTTLIGSSTNLLVSSAMTELGYQPIGFFEFTIPGSILAATGLLYVLLVVPRILPVRTSLTGQTNIQADKQFIAELDIDSGSRLIGMKPENGKFAPLKDISVRLIQRSGNVILPPFDDYEVKEGDKIILAATRRALTDILAKFQDSFLEEAENADADAEDEQRDTGKKGKILCEVMVTPTARIADMTLEQAALDRTYGATVLGIQRRARLIQRSMKRVRLEPGDVLLVVADDPAIDEMVASQDLIVMAGSIREMPATKKAPIAAGIFILTVTSAALGWVPIVVSAFAGATAMVITNCLNFRSAMRALDRKIFFLVGSSLALGLGLQETGAAAEIANSLMYIPYTDQPLVLVSVLFIIVAFSTNLLTNNACAILFTPIAASLAVNLGLDPRLLAVTVILGANCSFASPIGYQTNLLVMGPGHYRFADFMKAGIPLIFILWIAYIGLAKFYYGL